MKFSGKTNLPRDIGEKNMMVLNYSLAIKAEISHTHHHPALAQTISLSIERPINVFLAGGWGEGGKKATAAS